MQPSLDLKIQECGMQWAIALKRWTGKKKPSSACKEERGSRIKRE